MKILHFADVHLGRGFSGYAEASNELSEARYDTLERLVTTARKENCDAIAIAGDLFERPRMKKADVERTMRILNRFERGPVLLLPGNHDYITPESDLWRYVSDAKQDNIIILGQKEPVVLEDFDLQAIIYPAPCHSKHSPENEIGWVQEIDKDPEAIHIGLAHGSIPGVAPDLNDEHYPMTQKELAHAGVDLWLLGHIHVPWPDNPGPQDRILYAGTPEPDTANCPHSGTAIIIEIDESENLNVEKVSTGKYRFERWNEEVSSKEDLANMLEKVQANENKGVVARLTITGRLEEEAYDFWNQKIYPQLNDSFLYLKLDDTNLKRKITREQIDQEFPEESFPDRLLSTFIEEGEATALQTAYELIQEEKNEN